MNKGILIDRDGVINEDKGYVSSIKDFEFCDGVFEGLKAFKKMGFKIIIITNQSGIARGMFTMEEYFKLTNYYLNILKENDIQISECYFCPHHPLFSPPPFNNCNCRKPLPGMFLKAISSFKLNIKDCIAIGDQLRDLEPPQKIGIPQRFLITKSKIIKKSKIYTNSFNSLLDCAKYIDSKSNMYK